MSALYSAAATLLMPPTAPLLGLLIAFLLRFLPAGSLLEKCSLPLAIFSFGVLWVSATPAFSFWLGNRLGKVSDQFQSRPEAVVILGAGRYRDRVSGNERLSASSLERVIGASEEAPKGLPILVSGGRVHDGERLTESQMMASLLEDKFSTPVTWRDDCSRNTAENAVNSAEILHRAKVKSVLLVTHWWHMPRAAEVFSKAGLQVEPLSVGSAEELLPRAHRGIARWLPNAASLLRTQVYWREVLARVWYRRSPLPPIRSC
ncbi:YdcF family protein [Microbulbifer sp. OS29]|uniref:YdcF family protein n=1 Tax=Microbulbifer okhotskensis TaxID=2926617 RepID=A0A9X2ELH0_9GAMM|nr:YdcF family protein [Microbulbifer okhotskensis]MCO1333866.1 YdcF family protein [Microbulbifer okhotskensis]